MKPKHIKMYMEIADCLARASVGERLKVGSVIVKDNNIISTGYNALPAHIHGSLEDADGNTRPEVRHSEKNALMGLVKSTHSSVGATLFCTHACCLLCSIDIVDAGIEKVYYNHDYRSTSGVEYLKANGVEVIKYELPT
jgi:dCMP deaminase